MSIDNKLDSLFESVIDPTHKQLSRYVWQDDKLKPTVRFKILNGWSKINDVAPTGRVLIVGSITTYNYSNESDIDVTVELINPTPEQTQAAKELTASISGQMTAGPHEINFFVRPDIDYSKYNSVYDIIADSWESDPTDIGISIDDYMDNFHSVVDEIDMDKAELIRDIIDLKHLKEFSEEERGEAMTQAKAKVSEIEQHVTKLAETYKDVWGKRREAFNNLDKLKEYQHANELPDNVVYLLLRRYCYLNFLHELYEISKGGVRATEVPDVADAASKMSVCGDL